MPPFGEGHAKVGGRKRGVPNKLTREVQRFCLALVQDPEYAKKFAEDFKARRVAPGLEAMVWAYAYGRPRQQLEIVHNDEFRTVDDSAPTGAEGRRPIDVTALPERREVK
jgi:hypothetical protein